MTTFDDLVRDICSAQDDVTHLNEMGVTFESDTRKAQEARTEPIERLCERWDGLVEACERSKTLLDALRLDHGVGHLLSATQQQTYRAVDEQIQAALAGAKED